MQHTKEQNKLRTTKYVFIIFLSVTRELPFYKTSLVNFCHLREILGSTLKLADLTWDYPWNKFLVNKPIWGQHHSFKKSNHDRFLLTERGKSETAPSD
jgi:hypothetical protein